MTKRKLEKWAVEAAHALMNENHRWLEDDEAGLGYLFSYTVMARIIQEAYEDRDSFPSLPRSAGVKPSS